MKQGHQQRRNLGGPAPKQLWRSHVRGQIHGQGTGRACSRQAEQSRAVWGAQGRRGRQAGMWAHVGNGNSDSSGSNSTGERRGFVRRRHQAQQWKDHWPVWPQSLSLSICTIINSPSGRSAGIITACTQAVNFVSKLLQKRSAHTDLEIKHIRELLEFFKEFRNIGFENCCNISKQIYRLRNGNKIFKLSNSMRKTVFIRSFG